MKVKYKREQFIIVPFKFLQRFTIDASVLLAYLIFRARRGQFRIRRGWLRRELNFSKYRFNKALEELIREGVIEAKITTKDIYGTVKLASLFSTKKTSGEEEVKAGYEQIKELVDGLAQKFRFC